MPDAAQDFRLVSNSDLAKLDSRFIEIGEVLYKLSEVDSVVGGKVEEQLVVVKCIVAVRELHRQIVLFYKLFALFERFGRLYNIFSVSFLVLFGRNANDGFQVKSLLPVRHFRRHLRAKAHFFSANRLDDDGVPRLYIIVTAVKSVNLSGLSKSYSNYFHSNSPPSIYICF